MSDLNHSQPLIWREAPLSAFAASEANSFVDGPFGSDLKVSDYTESGVRILQLQNLGDGYFIDNNLKYASERKAISLSRCLVRPGDLLVAKMADPLARACIVPPHVEKGLIVADLIKLRLSQEHDPTFICSAINGTKFRREAERLATGTTRTRISLSTLKGIPLRVPTGQEQRKIGDIVRTVDGAIEQTEALIAKYQQIKAGLMHDLFTCGVTPDGHLRPTRDEAPNLYKDSPLGWIPKKWEVKRLGAILKECGGYLQTGPFGSQLHAHEYQQEGVPVVMPQDINDGIISHGHIARIVERKAEELSRHRMRVGDIVIARRGELSRAAAVADSHEGWICGTGCFLLRLGRSVLHSDFASCVYRHDLIQRQIGGMAVGTTMASLNNAVMERLFFPFCDPEEQSRITERLNNLDQFIWCLRNRVSKLHQQKQGLMHDLLTGRVRVKVWESGGDTI